MTIRDRILLDLKEIRNPRLLYQIFEFLSLLKRNSGEIIGNKEKVLGFAGSITHEEAAQIKMDIDETFNHLYRRIEN